ncbi:MAG: helix-turn-helix transcriptional regulator [Solirubrobacterales bacterium]
MPATDRFTRQPTQVSAAEMITTARQRAKISQTELATRLGTTQQTVSRWENGGSAPSFDSVMAAIGACGWDVAAALEMKGKLPRSMSAGLRSFDGKPAALWLLPWDHEDSDEVRLNSLVAIAKRRSERRRDRDTQR